MNSLVSRVAARYLQDQKITPAVKQAINAVLRRKGFDGNGRFQRSGQVLTVAFDVLKDFGLTISEPVTPMAFQRESGTLRLDIEFINESDPFSPIPINNSLLYLQYNQGPNGFEVVGYLS